MKKIIIPLLLLLVCSYTAMSQFATSKYRYARNDVEFAKQTFEPGSLQMANDAGTFRVGATVGFLLSKLRQDGFDDSKLHGGFQFGGHGQYFLNNQLVFMAGLLLAFHGSNFSDSDDYGYRITSLLMPLMVGYYVIPQLMVMAGVQPGFILSFKDTEDNDISDFWKGIDFGFKVGVAYDITENFTGKMAYNFGLVDMVEDNEFNSVQIRILEFSIIYWFLNR